MQGDGHQGQINAEEREIGKKEKQRRKKKKGRYAEEREIGKKEKQRRKKKKGRYLFLTILFINFYSINLYLLYIYYYNDSQVKLTTPHYVTGQEINIQYKYICTLFVT